ncbi:MAG TPA: SpoIIE family protein phosphatase, partial [Rectinemataceae bacterium]|nr:SpoIIE family protein phosphatase [Rectinemataceae bacterium]
AASIVHTEKVENVGPGDVIFMYTDGLIEAGAEEGAGPTAALGEILSGVEYGAEYHKRIMESALLKCGSADFTDDVTLLTAYLQ